MENTNLARPKSVNVLGTLLIAFIAVGVWAFLKEVVPLIFYFIFQPKMWREILKAYYEVPCLAAATGLLLYFTVKFFQMKSWSRLALIIYSLLAIPFYALLYLRYFWNSMLQISQTGAIDFSNSRAVAFYLTQNLVMFLFSLAFLIFFLMLLNKKDLVEVFRKPVVISESLVDEDLSENTDEVVEGEEVEQVDTSNSINNETEHEDGNDSKD